MTTHALTPSAAASSGRALRYLRLVGRYGRAELRSTLRTTEFVIGALGVPVLLFAMFGISNASELLPGGTSYAEALMVSFMAYGVISLAIFTFGERVAAERERGWTRALRVTPIPVAVPMIAKVIAATFDVGVIVGATGLLAALVADVSLTASTWVALLGVMILGMVAFSTFGFAISLSVRPRAATAICNLVFLPLAFASGFFTPLSELPSLMQTIAPWLPTYHFGQLAYQVVMPASDVAAYTGRPVGNPLVDAAAVLASFLAMGAVALLAARRNALTARS